MACPIRPDGRKEYTDDAGKVQKVLEWIGYKSHLLVDVNHEVVVAAKPTSTKTADCDALPDLVAQALANLPAGRIETLAYDKACDTQDAPRAAHIHLTGSPSQERTFAGARRLQNSAPKINSAFSSPSNLTRMRAFR